ncbi:hypothetical protein Bca4012_065639 [Brassica carinata]
MENVYQFQQRLVFFIGPGMLLSLASFKSSLIFIFLLLLSSTCHYYKPIPRLNVVTVTAVVKCNALEGPSGRRTITRNARNLMKTNPQETYSETFSVIDDGNNRIEQDCSKDDIVVFKESTVPLPIPNGVPEYTVEIFNACVSDCRIAEIHVSCGWFSLVRLVNPRVFRRIS